MKLGEIYIKTLQKLIFHFFPTFSEPVTMSRYFSLSGLARCVRHRGSYNNGALSEREEITELDRDRDKSILETEREGQKRNT